MEQPALGGRGEWVPICLSANQQFLGRILKSHLQGQKGINKTCINTFTEYFLANRKQTLSCRNKRIALKGCAVVYVLNFQQLLEPLGGCSKGCSRSSQNRQSRTLLWIAVIWL